MVTINELIEEFRALHPENGLARSAWGECCAASDAFIQLAMDRGYETLTRYTFVADNCEAWRGISDGLNPDPEVYKTFDANGRLLQNDAGYTMCSWHCIVDAGHVLIDFTARQYRNHYAFPHIVPMDERVYQINRQRAFAAKAGL
jgi:hypothetical protein